MVRSVVAYEAVDESVTVLPPPVPDAVAVFGCSPATAATGPTTHVAMWFSLPATATGRNGGHTQPVRFTFGSVAPTGARITSPSFSIVILEKTFVPSVPVRIV